MRHKLHKSCVFCSCIIRPLITRKALYTCNNHLLNSYQFDCKWRMNIQFKFTGLKILCYLCLFWVLIFYNKALECLGSECFSLFHPLTHITVLRKRIPITYCGFHRLDYNWIVRVHAYKASKAFYLSSFGFVDKRVQEREPINWRTKEQVNNLWRGQLFLVIKYLMKVITWWGKTLRTHTPGLHFLICITPVPCFPLVVLNWYKKI